MTDNIKLDNFLTSIQNLLDSRSVFAYGYISELLHSIADSSDIYNLIAEYMINFDFISEWQNAVSDNSLTIPEQPQKKIAFIFSMLNNIDDRNLDLDKILDHYYSSDVSKTSFELFKEDVIVPFRDLILDAFGLTMQNAEDDIEQNYSSEPKIEDSQSTIEEEEVSEAESTAEEEPIVDENEEDFESMLDIIAKMKQEIRKVKKVRGTKLGKTDLIALVSTLEFAIKTKSVEYFYALVLSIKEITKKNKKLKILSQNIEVISNKIIRS